MESMEEIYQNHSKKVYTFLLSKTCNHELAEELTQETFFCAVNSINKFKGNSSVLTWLCGIAQNLWLKYLRDNKSFEDLSNYEDMLTISSAEDELFIQWENVEILKSLHINFICILFFERLQRFIFCSTICKIIVFVLQNISCF